MNSIVVTPPIVLCVHPSFCSRRQAAITTGIFCNVRNQCSFTQSSRNVSVKLSINAFWSGFPCWMKCRLTPCWPAHASNAVPENSVPLSRIKVSGNSCPAKS